jgi:HAMP domain-containing protein
MFKNMSIRKKVMVILAIVYVISLSLAITGSYFMIEQDTIRESEEKTAIFSATMTSSQRYLAENIRPKVKELLPKTYFPEGTVGILMVAQTARYVQEAYPGYIYKVASPNPLNEDNLADEFEEEVIDSFASGDIEQWRGFVERDGKQFYAVATPLSAGANCIWCHDTPETANPKMVAKYGTRSGYGYKVGDVVGGQFTYVPTEVTLSEGKKKVAYFAGGFSLFFLLALLAVDRGIAKNIVRPIENFVSVADDISRGKMDREFEVDTNDEIGALAEAFRRMKVSLAKAMDILKR